MTIQDSSPERRNLVVLAVSIIIFYLAGGEFIDQSVKLQIINVKFANPDMLKHFVWVLLLWFIFRDWVTMQGSWKNDFGKEISQVILDSSYHPYLHDVLNVTQPLEDEHYIIKYTPAHGFSFGRIRAKSTSATYGRASKISGITGYIIFIKTLAYIVFTKPTLSTYAVPYCLATWAIGLIICNGFC